MHYYLSLDIGREYLGNEPGKISHRSSVCRGSEPGEISPRSPVYLGELNLGGNYLLDLLYL